MINVTERARQELKKLLVNSVDMPQACLRLIDRGQGKLGLDLDIEMQSDKLVECDGSTVLVVEHGLAISLKGVTLDVEDSAKGSDIVVCYESENVVNAKN